ncbi:MAG: hypothetical protein DWQ36_21705 [Acidobacteria bacterium]|nr:MAG: hypothetical protein DWQ30_09345 [Acidobacteriota bacterium]REK01120.1 MAG: hypothetical protein DWQ36_21705 [Acidobacteriota bacterium]
MTPSEDLARRAAHLLGLAGDFIDWSRLDDREFMRLVELVDTSQPEISDQLFEALSLLLQQEPLEAAQEKDVRVPGYDPLLGALGEGDADAEGRGIGAEQTETPSGTPAPATAFRVIRGGRR